MNHTTRRYPRTLREAFGMNASDAVAIHHYRIPLHRRIMCFCCRHGWIAIVLGLVAAILMEIT